MVNSPQSGYPARPATRSEAVQDLSRCHCPRPLPRIAPWRANRPSNRFSCTEKLLIVRLSFEEFLRRYYF